MKVFLSLGAAGRAKAARRTHHQTRQPRDVQAAQLLALLPDDEATFVAIFSQLEQSTQKRLARDTTASGLLPAALVADCANAVLAMRPYAKQKWQLGFNAYSNARLGYLAEQTHQLNLCAAMHANGVVRDTTLLMALRHTPVPALIALVTAHSIPPALLERALVHFVGRLPHAVARTWHAQKLISASTYLAMAAPDRSVQQGEALLAEVALGEIDGCETLAYLAPAWSQILTWLGAGLLTGKDVLAAFPGIAEAALRELFENAFIGVDTFVAKGKATDAELLEFVSAGDITAAACMNTCVVGEAVAQLWWQRKIIPETLYVNKRGEHWLRHEPLSQVHIRRARQSTDINATLLDLPAPEDPALRHSMRLRLYAEWVMAQSPTPAPQLWHRPLEQLSAPVSAASHMGALGRMANTTAATLRGVASSLLWGRPEAPAGTQTAEAPAFPENAEAPACFACTDDFDADHPAIALEGCQHPAVLHAECLRADFEGRMAQGYQARCPVVDCGHPTIIAHGFAMGLSADQLDALAASIIRPYRTPNWANCPTDGCVSGADIPPERGLMRDCAMCEKPVAFNDLDQDLQKTREVVLEMIQGMGESIGHEQTRPCYHCGTATLRTYGCTKMECGRDADTSAPVRRQGCGRTWDFITGTTHDPSVPANAEQCFVPCSGDMVRAGIFAPLPPGYIHRQGDTLPDGHATLQQLAQANARRLGWLP